MQENISQNFSSLADNIRIHLATSEITTNDFLKFYYYFIFVNDYQILTDGELFRFKASLLEAKIKEDINKLVYEDNLRIVNLIKRRLSNDNSEKFVR